MRIHLTVLMFAAGVTCFAQGRKMVLYQGGFDFHEGIYSTFEEFRNNDPQYPLERLLDDQGLPVTDLHKTSRKLYLKTDSGKVEITDKPVWGYCNRDVVYLNTPSGPFRMGMIGSLGHLVTEQTYSNWDPYIYGRNSYTVQQQQVLDMSTGKLMAFSIPTMELVLQRHPDLLERFNALKKKKKKQASLFLFLREYNEREPLFFPE